MNFNILNLFSGNGTDGHGRNDYTPPPPPPVIKAMRLLGVILICVFGILLTACGDDDEPSSNAAPTIANQTFSVAEDAAVDAEVGTVTASDADDDDLTFSITSGNTDDVFAINASSGLLTVAKALDFETTMAYTLKVDVSDGTASNTANITINVTDVEKNTAPTIANQTFSIAEDVAVDAEIGTVKASDADNDDLTFSITSGNTDDVFAINASSGLLTVAKALDFETTMAYTLKVDVSDGTASNTANITINVTDVEKNTAPTIANQTFSIAEDVAVDAEIGTVKASDADNDELTFSITSGNTSDAFAVNASSGLLTVANVLDFETTPTYTLVVSVSDGTDSNTADITINVTDVQEEEVQLQIITDITLVFTNKVDRTDVVKASAKDPDGMGAQELQILDTVKLTSGITYTLTFEISNALDPEDVEDITEFIAEEAEEQQFFFAFTDGSFSSPTGNGNIDTASDPINYEDEDDNDNPVGLETTWTTGSALSTPGTFRVRLQHQPDVKTSTSTATTGDTDFDLTFVLNISAGSP